MISQWHTENSYIIQVSVLRTCVCMCIYMIVSSYLCFSQILRKHLLHICKSPSSTHRGPTFKKNCVPFSCLNLFNSNLPFIMSKVGVKVPPVTCKSVINLFQNRSNWFCLLCSKVLTQQAWDVQTLTVPKERLTLDPFPGNDF